MEKAIQSPPETIAKKPKAVVTEAVSHGLDEGGILLGVGGEDPPLVRSAQPKSCHPFPFFHGSVKAEKVSQPRFDGKDRSSIRAVEIDKEGFLVHDQNVLDLQVGMEKTCIVQPSEKVADGSENPSLR